MLTANIENFIKEELECRCCGMLHIADEALICLQAFRYMLKRIYQKEIRININSACRCKKHNKDVGGVKTSRHECESKKSDAFDITSPDLGYKELFIHAVTLDLFSTVICYNKSEFVHVDTRPREKRYWHWDK